MSLQVDVHGIDVLDVCDDIHRASPSALIYGCANYIRFLLAAIPETRLHCIVAYEAGRAVAYLPLLEKASREGRPVFNSLPFFGSHGGPVCHPSTLADPAAIAATLMAKAYEVASNAGAISITIVESPLCPVEAESICRLGFVVVDDRIGQITPLPSAATNFNADLMERFHLKTRNAARKGQKLNQAITRETTEAAVHWLQEVHAESIGAMGGVLKSREVFAALLEQFPLEQSSRLYVGSVDGAPVSGLLVLLFQKTVEYFTPVVVESYRDQQALSALIVHAMAELSSEGYELWNWGGTWRSQEGVYRFKSRFGASEFPYRYFHKLFDTSVLARPPADLRTDFPYFYTCRYKT